MTEAETVSRLLSIMTPQGTAEYWLYMIRTATTDKADVLRQAQGFLQTVTQVGPTEFKTTWAIPPELRHE
jgi:hypothetical protein